MKRLHRAWAICLGCTLMLFVCGGLSVNAFSVTQPYVLAYGGFTNTQTSMINTIRALSYLGCMFAAPLFFRTLGYRLGTAVAVAFSAVSFAVFAASKTLAGFYLGGVLAVPGSVIRGEVADVSACGDPAAQCPFLFHVAFSCV